MGGDEHHNPPATFDDEEEKTVLMPTFSEGSFFADRYRIDRVLGSGAMGRVYAASELHSGRQVALKVLHKERLGEPETVARFKREAEVLASIGHPCIVEIFTFHHTPDGTPYLAMELLEGVTLKTRLQSAGRFEDPRELQEIVDGVAGALDAAHARGVVHRDMKPDNVFLLASGEPRAKLVDFGLSRIAKADKSLTHSGMILGTPRYMAPEQIRDASSAGPSVDIYSFGVVLYESLTGRSPYPAQDYGQLLGCVMEGRTTPLEQVRPELAFVAPVVARAIHPDASQRFQSCGELADAYGAALGIPSKRGEILARHSSRPAPRAGAKRPSIPIDKGSTLAFDAAALGGALPDLAGPPPEEPLAPPPPVWDRPAGGGAAVPPSDIPTEDERGGASTAHPPVGSSRPPAAPFEGGQGTEPMGDPYAPSPAASAFERVEKTEPMGDPHVSRPPPPALPSQGGDTMFLPNAGGLAPPGLPPSSPEGGWGAPSASSPSGPPPALGGAASAPPSAPAISPGAGAGPTSAPAKRTGCGIALFVVALVVVVLVSAAGGLALRAYTRGALELPFDIPGLSP